MRIMDGISYNDKIPNNVNLSDDKALQRALEHWLPNYLKWWREMGPEDSQEFQVYLRTAISVDPSGWAHFDYVKMPDYRWAFFSRLQWKENRFNLESIKARRHGKKFLANIVPICGGSSLPKAIPN